MVDTELLFDTCCHNISRSGELFLKRPHITMKKFVLVILLSCTTSFSLYAQMAKGKASYYADKFEGRLTANGEVYAHSNLTAAHKTLPFGTRVAVKNLTNSRTVVVRINDRGPFIEDRIIDLSRAAAKKLGFIQQGVTEVELKIVSDQPLQTPSPVKFRKGP